jgi:hypothetical protein
MTNQKLNQNLSGAIERSDYFCTIDCTDVAQLGPNTVISPAQHHSNLLKTLGTQFVVLSSNQRVGSSNLSGRAILSIK